MKYTINQITEGEDELILNYLELNEEIEGILAFMRKEGKRLIGWKDKEQVVIPLEDLLYMESVDSKSFAYTEAEVNRVNYSLLQLEVL